MTPVPPAVGLQRPPMGPVGASQYAGTGAPPSAPQPGAGQALPRMIFSLTKAVETLVRAVPSAAEEGDQISQLLQSIMVKASQGASGKASGEGAPY